LVILAGVLVTWALSAASGRTDVVRMDRDVRAGQTFVADDFAITGVAIDPGVEGLVPASALDDLVGRIAARDAAAGVLVPTSTPTSTAWALVSAPVISQLASRPVTSPWPQNWRAASTSSRAVAGSLMAWEIRW
jgi:hypothetical protein